MRLRSILPAVAILVLVSGIAVVLARAARDTGHQAHRHTAGMNMTEAEMQRWSDAWWSSHPRVGTPSSGAPAATFTVENFRFDHDGNDGTQVDTAFIRPGQTVLWQWVVGAHTITNGVDGNDPNAGTVFDQPSSMLSQQFSFTFNTEGTFPFFCRPHELDNMKGVVVVSNLVGVEPLPGGTIGFTAGPSPNPSRGGVSFRFALREPGRARAEVLDAGGRRIAIALDRELGAGQHDGAWDGRTAAGTRASAGLYYLRLTLRGHQESRAVVITR